MGLGLRFTPADDCLQNSERSKLKVALSSPGNLKPTMNITWQQNACDNSVQTVVALQDERRQVAAKLYFVRQ